MAEDPTSGDGVAEAFLKVERDRYLAFAFCGSDMLLEVDGAGRVAFAAGASEFLVGSQVGTLINSEFLGLVDKNDRDLAAGLVQRAVATGKRFEGVRVVLSSAARPEMPVAMTGFVLPALKGHCFLSLRHWKERGEPAVAPPQPNGAVMPDEEVAGRVALARRLVAEQNFDIAFQPVVSFDTRAVHHMEALLRLRPETLDMPAADFVRFAERTGLIVEFDLTMCAAVLKRLIDVSYRGEPMAVAVNLSGRSLEVPEFPRRLDDLLRAAKKMTKLMIFEITDSGAIRDLQAANEFIQNLRYRGFRVTLDDFGTRGAAFHQLRRLEVDYVKIAGSFIREARDGDRGKSFVSAMAGLCKAVGVVPVAKEVEDPNSLLFLRSCGIHYGQGWLFGRPVIDPDLLSGGQATKDHNRAGAEGYALAGRSAS